MRFIVWVAVGLLGGVLGGMGMGGGTILIPLLTLLCGVPQHLAQSVNLVTFLPMSFLSLRIHSENGLLDRKSALPVSGSAVIVSAVCAYFVRCIESSVLRKGFGIFLCVLAFFQLIGAIRSHVAEKRQ